MAKLCVSEQIMVINMSNYKNEALAIIAEKFPGINLLGSDDVFVVPVGEICELLELKVEFTKLAAGQSGYLDIGTKTILVNDDYFATRNSFTIAHEIGHYVLHNGNNNRFDQYHKYTVEELKKERDANEFAGRLLMPQDKFEEIFKELRGNIVKIADFFGVSSKAAEVRCFCLGLIDNL